MLFNRGMRERIVAAELAPRAAEVAAAIDAVPVKTANTKAIVVTPNQVAALDLAEAVAALREYHFDSVADQLETLPLVKPQTIEALAAKRELVLVVVVTSQKPSIAICTRERWRELLQPTQIGAS